MANFDWDKHPIATQDDLAKPIKGKKASPSEIESFARGAVSQVPVLGSFADESEAGVKALLDAALTEETLPDAYSRELQDVRQQIKQAETTNPQASLAGKAAGFVGSAALPLGAASSVLGKLGQAAAIGAATGLGESEAPIGSEESIKDLAKGAAIGGALQGGISGISKAVPAIASKFRGLSDLLENYKLGKQGLNIATKQGAENVAQRQQALAKDIASLTKEGSKASGAKIEEAIAKNATDQFSNVASSDVKNIASYLRNNIAKLGDVKDRKDLEKALNEVQGVMYESDSIIPRFITPEDMVGLRDNLKRGSFFEDSTSLSDRTKKVLTEASKLADSSLKAVPAIKEAQALNAPFQQMKNVVGDAIKGDVASESSQLDKINKLITESGSKDELTRIPAQKQLQDLLDLFQKTGTGEKLSQRLKQAPEMGNITRLASQNQTAGLVQKVTGPVANVSGLISGKIEQGLSDKAASVLPESTAAKVLGQYSTDMAYDASNVSTKDLMHAFSKLGDTSEEQKLKEEINKITTAEPTRRPALLFKLMQNSKFREAMSK